MKLKIANALSLALIMAILFTSIGLADSISADADDLVLVAPHANSVSVTQNGGTTVSYNFSAIINNTGNSANDVFPGTVNVGITRSGDWLSGGIPLAFEFTSYGTPQVGAVTITVPCGVSGTVQTIAVNLLAGTSTNGKSLSPNSVSLSFNRQALMTPVAHHRLHPTQLPVSM